MNSNVISFITDNPRENSGHISSITLKEFLSIKGDGKLSIKELVKSDCRAFLYYPLIKNDPFIEWYLILKKKSNTAVIFYRKPFQRH